MSLDGQDRVDDSACFYKQGMRVGVLRSVGLVCVLRDM